MFHSEQTACHVLLAPSTTIVVKYNNVENQKHSGEVETQREQLSPLYFQVCKRVSHVFIHICQSSAHTVLEIRKVEGNDAGEFISTEPAGCQSLVARRTVCLGCLGFCHLWAVSMCCLCVKIGFLKWTGLFIDPLNCTDTASALLF